ncbi:MAG: triose-phosphate isomerase [Gemmatimonadaceae bacterium]
MKRPIFAANWKMNNGPSDAKAFMRTFLIHYARRPDRSVIIFPSALALPATADALKDRTDIQIGVQNIHWEDQGAFTGENSATIARDAGARFTLVGHSERRHVFGETDDETARKCAAAVRAGLTPMLCVGERLDERERGDAERVVRRQVTTGLSALHPAQIGGALIAYEPVWAIGTGRTATPEDASTMHVHIRAILRGLAPDRGGGVPILYGGSVNRDNARPLLAAPEIDGVLVGGASLDADGWGAIVRT